MSPSHPLPDTHTHKSHKNPHQSYLITIQKTIVPNNSVGGNLPSVRSSDSLAVSRKSARFPSGALETFETLNRQRTKVTGNSKLSMLGDTSPGTNVPTDHQKCRHRGDGEGRKRVRIRRRNLVRQKTRKSDTANNLCCVNKRVNR